MRWPCSAEHPEAGAVMGPTTLAAIEAVIDEANVAPRLEGLLPVGVRPRQLSVRTLLVGIMLALFDGRPAHLTRVHAALGALGEQEQRRLGVLVAWKRGPHRLTYRQIERTFGLLVDTLSKEYPDGMPSEELQGFVDALIEASIGAAYKEATSALAVDWTDVEAFARPPVPSGSRSAQDKRKKEEKDGSDQAGSDANDADANNSDANDADANDADAGDALAEEGRPSADPEASWGHRRGDGPGQKDELFYGNYLQLATMVREENGEDVPELVRRLLLTSCHVDPPPAFVPVLEDMVRSGVALGEVLNESGYSHRVPEHWALPLRALGADLVMDLHPHDRGTQGTSHGAICWNGGLYCPSTPKALFDLEPLGRGANEEETAAHDAKSAELDRYKLGVVSSDDADGFHRVACPAILGKVRCPRRAESMALSAKRPEIIAAPKEPPTCCTQKTLTVPPSVNAKTKQKHSYPSKAHRLSYGRRSAAERSNATVKDPASNDISRGWCRLMGLTSMTLMLSCLFVVRNQRILASFEAKAAENQRRLAQGLAPRTRRRRRTTISDLAAAGAHAPP
jgi:hypothetical protein